MSKIKKNYVYNLTLNIVTILASIIAMPLLSRKLGSEQLGIYSYNDSIVSFFMLFAFLGIKNYGNRLIASAPNKTEKSKQFFSLFGLQLILSLIVVIFYFLYIMYFCDSHYRLIALIQTINLLSVTFDINWFFYGNERFKPSLIIGIISKFIYLLFIIFFVHDTSDLINYTLIASLNMFLNNFLLFFLLRGQVISVKVTCKDIFAHLKPCLVLFIPLISVSLYKILDKIMLGQMANMIEVGLYEQAEKILKIPLQLTGTLETVMFPRLSYVVANNSEKDVTNKVDIYITNSLNLIMFVVLPIIFGLICISDDFVPLFLGNEFVNSSILLKGLLISVIFITYGCVIRTHYILPKKMDKLFIISVTLGAVTNIVLNLILIPLYQARGAVIATIFAEFVVVFYQTLCLRKQLNIKKYMKIMLSYLLKVIIMSIFVILIGKHNYSSLYLKILIQIIVGVIIYAVMNQRIIKLILNSFGKKF